MSGKVNDCCCGFPSGENASNCERCGLIKQRNELLHIAEKLRWQLSGFAGLYCDNDPEANKAMKRYERFLDKHNLRSLVQDKD